MTKFFRGGGCAVSSRNSHRRDERRAQLTGLLDASGTALRLAAPLVDLLVRFSLAKVFFAPGMLPSSHLFQFVQTGWPTIIVQVAGPVLLAAGLWVRPVALLMLVLTLLAQTSGPLQDEHLFWAALFGWYVAQGAGPLSLDHVLGKGLGLSPLPLAGRAMAAADWFDRWVGPLYRLLVRLWLAVALAGVALASGMLPVTASAMLPATASGMLPRPWALFAAALLTLGLGTPLVAAGLLVAGTSMALAGTGHAMTVYAPLLLALLRWISLLQHGCVVRHRRRTTRLISSLWERVLQAWRVRRGSGESGRGSPLSIGTITICSSRCFTKWQPLPCRRPTSLPQCAACSAITPGCACCAAKFPGWMLPTDASP